MSFVILSSHTSPSILLRTPSLAHLKSLIPADLPFCPCCGGTMVKTGSRTIKSLETDCLGREYFQAVELTKLKCSSRNCPMNLEYLSSSYQHSKVFYKTAAQLVEILGLDLTTSLIGVEQPVLKAAFNIFASKPIEPSSKSTISFHLIKTNSRAYLLLIDITNKMILDVWTERSNRKLSQAALEFARKYQLNKVILPKEESFVDAFESNKTSIKFGYESCGSAEVRSSLIISSESMKTIEKAHDKAINVCHHKRFSKLMKKELLGFF